MNPKLSKFLKSKEIKKSVFFAHKEEILEIKNLGYSANIILEYLETVGVKAKKGNLNRWLKRQKLVQVQPKAIETVTQKSTHPKSPFKTTEDVEMTQSEEEAVAKLMQSCNRRVTAEDMMNHGRNT